MSTSSVRDVARQVRSWCLTLRGAAFVFAGLVALACAYAFEAPDLLVIGCFVLATPGVAWLSLARIRPSFEVARIVTPAVLMRGTPGTVSVRVHNAAPRASVAGTCRDELPWAEGVSEERMLPALAPGAVHTVRYSATPERRGVIEFGPLVVAHRDPFSLAVVELAVGKPERVVVTPAVVPLESGAVEIAAERGAARLFQHRALAGDHDLMTREYRHGDALRRVHWRASAHHGELMVREDEKRSHAAATLIVETRARAYPDVDARIHRPDSAHFEWALDFTASLREHLVAAGLALRVVETAGRRQFADPLRFADFVESLARAELVFEPRVRDRLVGEARGSAFAILGVPDAALVAALTTARAHVDTAVAFVSDAIAANPHEQLLDAGWRVVTVSPAEPLARAWLRAGGDDE